MSTDPIQDSNKIVDTFIRPASLSESPLPPAQDPAALPTASPAETDAARQLLAPENGILSWKIADHRALLNKLYEQEYLRFQKKTLQERERELLASLDPPRKHLSPFCFYSQFERGKYKELQSIGLSYAKITQKISKSWKKMTELQKEFYKYMSARDYEDHYVLLNLYNSQVKSSEALVQQSQPQDEKADFTDTAIAPSQRKTGDHALCGSECDDAAGSGTAFKAPIGGARRELKQLQINNSNFGSVRTRRRNTALQVAPKARPKVKITEPKSAALVGRKRARDEELSDSEFAESRSETKKQAASQGGKSLTGAQPPQSLIINIQLTNPKREQTPIENQAPPKQYFYNIEELFKKPVSHPSASLAPRRNSSSLSVLSLDGFMNPSGGGEASNSQQLEFGQLLAFDHQSEDEEYYFDNSNNGYQSNNVGQLPKPANEQLGSAQDPPLPIVKPPSSWAPLESEARLAPMEGQNYYNPLQPLPSFEVKQSFKPFMYTPVPEWLEDNNGASQLQGESAEQRPSPAGGEAPDRQNYGENPL